MASNWVRNPHRSGRFSKTSQKPEDHYVINKQKSPRENLFEMYQLLASRKINENERLCLLNELVKLLDDCREANLGFTTEELLYCLSASLIHNFTQIRAGTLRAIRHLLKTTKDLQIFNGLQLPYLICRSLDVLLKNEEERVQALKLIRKMLSISAHHISPALLRCLVALGESGTEDRMLRAYLAVLCEFGVLNPRLLIVCGGVSVITRNVLECHSPRIAESLCGVLLHLLERPHTRNIASVRLDCLAAPYCDFTYRLGIMDKNKDARDLRFTCSRLALLSVLRSFTGVLEFCNPNRPSGLKAIVDILYLNQLEVRKAILELLYEILGLPQPIWTDEYSAALAVVDPAEFQDIWRLSDGFVAAEGRSILPSLASHTPNICEIHMALLLYCFLETGLLNALIEVTITSDPAVSVRATVLLGKIVHMMHTYLPSEVCSLSSALPLLVSKATEGNHQARAAISTLQSYHQMLRNRPAACSLFLDNIIQSGSIIQSRIFKRDVNTQEVTLTPVNKHSTMDRIGRRRHDSVSSNASGGVGTLSDVGSNYDVKDDAAILFLGTGRRHRSKLLNLFEIRESERLMRESNVLINDDGSIWDWDIVITILKLPSKKITTKMDDNQCKFIHRLVAYFKPSSNRFSHRDLVHHGRHVDVMAGLILIDWLLQNQELECIRLLTDLFTDVHAHLLAITTSRSVHDCLFSPQHMTSTMCQQYFLYIGRMSKNEKGQSILYNTDIFKQLSKLIMSTSHLCYIKLLISGLDYSLEIEPSYPRIILELALTEAPSVSARLYATQFLLILLRAKIPNFEVWGIPLLIKQTLDKDNSIILSALEIIDEACHDRPYLEELVNVWPKFSTTLEPNAGKLVEMRFYSIPRGINHPKAKIQEEIECWVNGYNKRYVLLLEAETHSTMTLHTKSEDGTYSRRNCSARTNMLAPNILPHLYGQLVQTTKGMTSLQKFGDLPKLIEVLKQAKCGNETECLSLKAAIWALGHTATSTEGVEFLNDPMSRVYEKLIFLARFSDYFSIRSTCLNVLSLIGCTNAGSNVLSKLDWMCVRHDRNTYWPIYEEEDWFSKQLTPVRHQLGDITPYNYTSLQENVSSYLGVGATVNDEIGAFYFDETTETIPDDVEGLNESTNGEISSSTRSRTLPEASYSVRSFLKHTRSLSESKTTDGISLQRPTSRQRFNSGGTDSNTSGVSSCDSIYNRNVITELHHTLSPIPSSSNLMDIKKEEKFRRMSLTGIRYRDHATMTPRDVQGYNTLRSLRHHRWPQLSESAAADFSDIMDSPQSLMRTNKLSSLTSSQRKMKVRSLDRQHYSFVSQSTSTGLDYSELEDMRQTSNASRLLNKNDTKGPCFTGIALPKNLSDIFPSSSDAAQSNGTYVSLFIKDLENNETTSSLNLSNVRSSLLSESINEGDEGGESVVSSISDLSITSKRARWTGKHNRNECLHCCRSKMNRLQMRTDSETSFMVRKKLQQQNSSLMSMGDVSFNSPESVFSDESITDRITGNILRHVQRMANPVWTKMSKMALLELKQKHPHSFQDICLYSEVCRALGLNTFRILSRRFLQEIFLDLDFDSFYNEPNEIIDRHEVIDDSIMIINRCSDRGDDKIGGGIGGGNANNNEPVILQMQAAAAVSSAALALYRLKSPPLASLYETSIENLSESLNSKSNKLNLVSHTINQQLQPLPTQNINNNNNNTKNNTKNSSTSDSSNSDRTDSAEAGSVVNVATTVASSFRPRLHTFELDLSCTRNKFPIRDRTAITPTSSSVGIFPQPRQLGASSSMVVAMGNNQDQASFTKSSSLSTPGSLYCERRLFSKSEATLMKK